MNEKTEGWKKRHPIWVVIILLIVCVSLVFCMISFRDWMLSEDEGYCCICGYTLDYGWQECCDCYGMNSEACHQVGFNESHPNCQENGEVENE